MSSNVITSVYSIVDKGDTAWVISSSALVMLMTPALGFFYGGLVRHKNILTTIIQSYAIFASVSIVWALIGYSLTFAPSLGHFMGDSYYMGLRHVGMTPHPDAPTIPGSVFFFFQLCACAITPALIMGSVAERFSVVPSCLFSAVWVLVVYCPIGHWLFGDAGWLKQLGAKDFAGGMLVHMSAGFSSFAMALVSGPRKAEHHELKPSNLTYVVLGAALLWFGWFGYNGGAAFAANNQAGVAIISTNLSASSAALSWCIIDYIYSKKVTAMGISIGSVCGLISMTAGCGFCESWASLIIGFLGGIFSNLVIRLREKYFVHTLDDSLDVFACHGVCGTWGVFATGLWASRKYGPGDVDGAFYGGGKLLGYQIVGIIVVAAWSFPNNFTVGIRNEIYRNDQSGEGSGENGFGYWRTWRNWIQSADGKRKGND